MRRLFRSIHQDSNQPSDSSPKHDQLPEPFPTPPDNFSRRTSSLSNHSNNSNTSGRNVCSTQRQQQHQSQFDPVLHKLIVDYAAASKSAAAQMQKMKSIIQLVHQIQGSDKSNMNLRNHVSRKTLSLLITTSSQRSVIFYNELMGKAKKKKDAGTGRKLIYCTLMPQYTSNEDNCSYDLTFLSLLQVLAKEYKDALLAIAEKLPSTLVLVLQALLNGDNFDYPINIVEKDICELLSVLVSYQEGINELISSDTLVLLFTTASACSSRHSGIFQTLRTMSTSSVTAHLKSNCFFKYVHEKECILKMLRQLVISLESTELLATIAFILLCSHDVSDSLQNQIRSRKAYDDILDLFMELIEQIAEEIVTNDQTSSFKLIADKMELSLLELALSGDLYSTYANCLKYTEVFELMNPELLKEDSKPMCNRDMLHVFQCIFFQLQLLTRAEIEKKADTHIVNVISQFREGMQCSILQKINQILILHPFHYILAMEMGLLVELIKTIDNYSELTKQTIESLLSNVCIEFRLIPLNELKAMNSVLCRASCSSTCLRVFLNFSLNLARFELSYLAILQNSGFISICCGLFYSKAKELASRYDIFFQKLRCRFSAGSGESSTILKVPSGIDSFIERPSLLDNLELKFDIWVIDDGDVSPLLECFTFFVQHADIEQCRSLWCDQVLQYLAIFIQVPKFHQVISLFWMALLQHVILLDDDLSTTAIDCLLQVVRSLLYRRCKAVMSKQELKFDVETLETIYCIIDCFSKCLSQYSCLSDLISQNLDKYEKNDRISGDSCSTILCNKFIQFLVVCDGVRVFLGIIFAFGHYCLPDEVFTQKNLCSFVRCIEFIRAISSAVNSPSDYFQKIIRFQVFGHLIHEAMTNLHIDTKKIQDTQFFHRVVLWQMCSLVMNNQEVLELMQKDNLDQKLCESLRVHNPLIALIVFQLLSLWASRIPKPTISRILEFFAKLCNASISNVVKLSNAGLVTVLLSCFTECKASVRQSTFEFLLPADSQELSDSLQIALLVRANCYHEILTSLLVSLARMRLRHSELRVWVALILEHSIYSPLFDSLLLVCDADNHGSLYSSIPSISFQASSQSCAYLLIPDLQSHLSSKHQLPHQRTMLMNSTISGVGMDPRRLWPPANGYTVCCWLRIDSKVTCDPEAEYKRLYNLMQCIVCQEPWIKTIPPVKLDCDHVVCSSCYKKSTLHKTIEQCPVCNPPKIILYSFRSGDGKSVMEAYIKSSRIYLQSNANRSVRFHHTQISTGSWFHVGISHVHQRFQFQSSTASLFINGVLQEVNNVSYPSAINITQQISGTIGLPPQPSFNTSISPLISWTLGPFYLFNEPLSELVINAVLAVGANYDQIFLGEDGEGMMSASVYLLGAKNLELLDEFILNDCSNISPATQLRHAVDSAADSMAVRVKGQSHRSSSNHPVNNIPYQSSTSSLSAQQQYLSASGLSTNIESAVPQVAIPLTPDNILLAYSARNASLDETQTYYQTSNSRLDGKPLAQVMGNAVVYVPTHVADISVELCNEGLSMAFLFLEQANSSVAVDLSLNFLACLIIGHTNNLKNMEKHHGYEIASYLLRLKTKQRALTNIVTRTTLRTLFRIVGFTLPSPSTDSFNSHKSPILNDDQQEKSCMLLQQSKDKAICNLHAFQHFILDYSVWQNVDKETQQTLFSTVYSALVTGELSMRNRNRRQLQSLVMVRQLLYVLLDPNIADDILPVIIDLILVCLTEGKGGSDSDFSDCALFLVSTLSLRFGRQLHVVNFSANKNSDEILNKDCGRNDDHLNKNHKHLTSKSTYSLCLSPRGDASGKRLSRKTKSCLMHLQQSDSASMNDSFSGDPAFTGQLMTRQRQNKVRGLMLEMLCKVVQKQDLRLHSRIRRRSDDIPFEQQKEVLPTSLIGIRKALSPRWIGYFLFSNLQQQNRDVRWDSVISQSIIPAIQLLSVLLLQPKYESSFRREGYYRALAYGLPVSPYYRQLSNQSCFSYHILWYNMFCILLGPPVDGMPHEIRFEIYHLSKDFQSNIQSNVVNNMDILAVIIILLRRSYTLEEHDADLTFQREENLWHKEQSLHREVIRFIMYLYENMSSFRDKQFSTSEKRRTETLEGLAILVCASARKSMLVSYFRSKDHLKIDKTDTDSLFSSTSTSSSSSSHPSSTFRRVHVDWVDWVKKYEQCATVDPSIDNPFKSTLAYEGLQLLVHISTNIVLTHQRGVSILQSILDSVPGAVLVISLHDSLSLGFQSLLLHKVIVELRAKLSSVDILDDKRIIQNLSDFCELAVERMQLWQRAQQGDLCPVAAKCCFSKGFHFQGGPEKLLDLVLYVLAETPVGSSWARYGGGPVGGEKHGKGKKRRQLRQFLGNIGISRAKEYEQLTEALYNTMNTVILHLLDGHRVEADDSTIITMLNLVHSHREVTVGTRNGDQHFFNCLCKHLYRLLFDENVSLQAIAIHLWCDLMYFNRQLVSEILTISYEVDGAAPYSVNLLKGGFDLLLVKNSNPTDRKANEMDMVVCSPGHMEFTKWLELMGAPIKVLVNNLEHDFMRHVIHIKEQVSEKWNLLHRKNLQNTAKVKKREADRVRRVLRSFEQSSRFLENLQQAELKRQVRWRQDQLDREKFTARQWQLQKNRLLFDTLGYSPGGKYEVFNSVEDVLLPCVAQIQTKGAQSNYPYGSASWANDWRLDFTEGPYRMRKKITKTCLITYKMKKNQKICNSSSIREEQDFRTNNNEREWGSQQDSAYSPAIFSETDNEAGNEKNKAMKIPARQRSISEGNISFTGYDNSKREIFGLDMDVQASSSSRNQTDNVVCDHNAESLCISMENELEAELDNNLDFVAGHTEKEISTTSTNSPINDDNFTCKSFSSICLEELGLDLASIKENQKMVDNSDCMSVLTSDSTITRGTVNGTTTWLEYDEENDFTVNEDVVDEKLRPLLVPGDEINEHYDCYRVDGMNSCQGILLLCSDHVYMVDNYQSVSFDNSTILSNEAVNVPTLGVEKSNSSLLKHQDRHVKVVEVKSMPFFRKVLRGSGVFNGHTPSNTISGGEETHISGSAAAHECRFWPYEDITEIHKRRYQLRHVAIEIFAHDGRNYLINFDSVNQRERAFNSLLSRCPNVKGAANGLDETVGGDIYSQVRKLLRINMTERWQYGEISNFEYLMHLNTLAGRSYNDFTQYPVFPWILSDYESEEIDLNDPSVYRDLTKPMGALYREKEFRERFESLNENASENFIETRPFHYGTHYSSAGTVLHYLIRLQPFTDHCVQLQGGKFDHADRLFSSISRSWKSAAGLESGQQGTQDVKELIPEFFYLADFLENKNDYDFGVDQFGNPVHHVQLPPWAKGSPREFVRINRQALESSYVSENLNHWIDLVFGFKQQGPAAVEACNVFYYLTYEGAVDLECLSDTRMKEAIISQINEFGQTPSQLFKLPHVVRTTKINKIRASTIDLDRTSLSISRVQNRILNNLSTMTSENSKESCCYLLINAALLQHEQKRIYTRNAVEYALRHPGIASILSKNPSVSHGCRASIKQMATQINSGGMREEKILTVGEGCLLLPPRYQEYISWGFHDRAIRLLSVGNNEGGTGDSRILLSFDTTFNISVAQATVDGRTIVVGSCRGPTIQVWSYPVKERGKSGHLKQPQIKATLSTPCHIGSITAVAVSRPYSNIVCGCSGGNISLWDLNRLRFVRKLANVNNSRTAISVIDINDESGDILICSSSDFGVFDVNGNLLVTYSSASLRSVVEPNVVGTRSNITAALINSSNFSEWEYDHMIITGHIDGSLCIWTYFYEKYDVNNELNEGAGNWKIELKGWHSKSKSRSPVNSLLISADQKRLFSGGKDGRLLVWVPYS